jgi:hypothetical protein
MILKRIRGMERRGRRAVRGRGFERDRERGEGGWGYGVARG